MVPDVFFLCVEFLVGLILVNYGFWDVLENNGCEFGGCGGGGAIDERLISGFHY